MCLPSLLIFELDKLSNPCAKSKPSKPNMGIKIRNPKPADLFNSNGLKLS